jgi:hypothetical protein
VTIAWGSWVYNGGNGMRVGLDVSWTAGDGGAIVNSTVNAAATVLVYTENEYTYADNGEVLTYSGGSISGSTTYNNTDGPTVVNLRSTQSYVYTYGSTEYGSSPGNRTFAATVSNTYNGVSPTESVVSAIPLRPWAAPVAPSNVHSNRVSDTSQSTTWTNNRSASAPWGDVAVQRDDAANGVWNNIVGTTGGAATSYTDSPTIANYAYRYRVRSESDAGVSAWVQGDLLYTTPAAPSGVVRSGSNGANQIITWTNNVSSYIASQGLVERSDGGAAFVQIAVVGNGVSSYTDTYPASRPSITFVYRVRCRTNGGVQGTLYSSYSAVTSSTSGNVAPNAPTLASPANNSTIDLAALQTFAWTISDPNAGDSQSKFDLRARIIGAATWTTYTVTTPHQYNQFASNQFAAGNWEWQVRTYDALGLVGPYSGSDFFTAANVPGVPSITSPVSGATVDNVATLSWSVPDQTDYQVRKVADSSGVADTSTVYFDTGDVIVASDRSLQLDFPVNNRWEHIQLRVMASGLWSSWADSRNYVSWQPPLAPTVILTTDGTAANLTVTITNPPPTGGAPDASYNDIYISSSVDPEFRAATLVSANGAWVWWFPAARRVYTVRVVAVAGNGTTASST